MFKPTTMTRVTLSGLKKDLERVSNNLAEERLIHLVEYENNYDGFETLTGFIIYFSINRITLS